MPALFEWDPAKAAANVVKHQVTFELASLAFADPFVLSDQDRIEEGELRWQAIGMVQGVLLLFVAHTVRDEGEDEVIRIISARQATRRERKRYEDEPR